MRDLFPPQAWITGLMLLLLCPGVGLAEDADQDPQVRDSVETVFATVYRDVEVLQTDPRGVTFRHSKGLAKLPYDRFEGDFRAQFLKQEQAWEEEALRAQEANANAVEKGPAKVTNFPGVPAPALIVVHIQTPPLAPCGHGPAAFVTYPATRNLPCNLLAFRERSLRHLFAVQSLNRLRPFGANARSILPPRGLRLTSGNSYR